MWQKSMGYISSKGRYALESVILTALTVDSEIIVSVSNLSQRLEISKMYLKSFSRS